MPSSYTLSCRFTLQATGENNNTWGVILNTGVFALVDYALAGRLSFPLSGPVTLTTALGATDQARAAFLDVTGGTGGQVNIPAVSKGYFVRNGSTGDVVIAAGGATNAILKTGDIGPVFSDGANTYPIRLSGLNLRDYIASQVTGGGNLPAPVIVGRVLVVRNAGLGPVWLPDLLDASSLSPGTVVASLGYTPANKAGDAFTGTVAAPVFDVMNLGRFQIGGTVNFAQINWDIPNGAYERQDWLTGVHTWGQGGVPRMTLDPAGNLAITGVFSGALAPLSVTGPMIAPLSISTGKLADGAVSAAKIFDGNVTTPKIADGAVTPAKLAPGAVLESLDFTPSNDRFAVQADANSVTLFLDASDDTFFQIDFTTQKLIYAVGGVAMFSVDSLGNMRVQGSVTPNVAP